jgi:aspartate aminotransferase-like enzyme
MGFEMLVPDEVASPVTTAVRAKPEMSVEDYVEWLRRERRLRIAGATGELAGKVFRVAHMGRAAEPEVVDAYLASTREYLEEAGLC